MRFGDTLSVVLDLILLDFFFYLTNLTESMNLKLAIIFFPFEL